MPCPRRRCHVSVVCAIAAGSLVAAPTAISPAPVIQTRGIQLIDSADSLLGDGAALGDLSLVMKGESLPEGTRWLGIPVSAINVATYWSALRANGVLDPIRGFGALLAEH